MSEKKNFWNQVISAMNGAITFGKIRKKVMYFKSSPSSMMEGISCHLMRMGSTGFTLLNSRFNFY